MATELHLFDTQPLGVIRIAAQSARIYPWPRILGSPPNAFLAVGTGQRGNLARTKYKSHSFEPIWMETLYIVVYPQDLSLNLSLYGHHEHRSDTLIGATQWPITDIVNHGEITSISTTIAGGGKGRADLLFDLTFLPAIPTFESVGNNSMQPGVVSIAIYEASDLDVLVHRHNNIAVQVTLGTDSSAIHTTQRKKGNPNTTWNTPITFFCPHLASTMVSINVIDMHCAEVVGHFSLSLEDVLESSKMGTEWWPLNGSRRGRIRLGWKWIWIRYD